MVRGSKGRSIDRALFFGTLLFLNCILVKAAANQKGAPGDELKEQNPEFQAINEYLTGFSLASGHVDKVVKSLQNAIQFFRDIGSNNPLTAREMGIFSPLRKGQQDMLVDIMNKLIVASSSCTSENLSFLRFVADHVSKSGQFLNTYVQSLIFKCLELDGTPLVRKFAKSIGKNPSYLYDVLGDLANEIHKAKKVQVKSVDSNSIKIKASQDEKIDPATTLSHLKELRFNADDLKIFNKNLRKYFASNLFEHKTRFLTSGERDKLKDTIERNLFVSCTKWLDRQDDIVTQLAESSIYSTDTVRGAIELARQDRPDLDLHLELTRVCEQISLRKQEILNSVEDLKWGDL